MYFMKLATFAAILIVGNSNISRAEDASKKNPLHEISRGISEFSANFYKQIYPSNVNLICSPLSVNVVLSMLASGAREHTEREMQQALGLPTDNRVTRKGFQRLIDNMVSTKKIVLRLAQKVYLDKRVKVKDDFQSITEEYFRSESENVDFNDPRTAAKNINDWIAEQTNDCILQGVVPRDIIGARLVLISTAYFKASWRHQFHDKNTRPRQFHFSRKVSKNVPTMYQRNVFNYGQLSDFDAIYVELPYESEDSKEDMSMFIFRPYDIEGLNHIALNLDKIDFQKLHRSRNMTELHLYLPKFETTSSLSLNTPLENLGMKSVFSNADFSGISDVDELKVSKVIQKAFIEVNERGTEAAAATVVVSVITSTIVDKPEPLTVRVNRPFMYAIYHKSTNTVVFQGHVKNFAKQ